MSESNTRAEIVEVMAVAIKESRASGKTDCRYHASAALTALEAAGMAVVPLPAPPLPAPPGR